jgi:hypothetical protein
MSEEEQLTGVREREAFLGYARREEPAQRPSGKSHPGYRWFYSRPADRTLSRQSIRGSFSNLNRERNLIRAKKEGWQRGQGRFSKEVKTNKGPGDNPEAKGENLSRVVYDENDKPAVRGTRPRFS